ncbi:hypothetical protein HK105_201209 [Polyrhizophydium stewartii]|uniref:Protein kinase domain-containing protein n=1 Tax=Polyrhizophydium stewartii TaxID=2732419 RepID=A0ABR4NHF7_9FUNG
MPEPPQPPPAHSSQLPHSLEPVLPSFAADEDLSSPQQQQVLNKSGLASKLRDCKGKTTLESVDKLIGPNVRELLSTKDIKGSLSKHFSERMHAEEFSIPGKPDEPADANTGRDVDTPAANNNTAGAGAASPSPLLNTNPAVHDRFAEQVVGTLKDDSNSIDGIGISDCDLASIISTLSAIEARLAELGDSANTDKLKKAHEALVGQRGAAMQSAKDKRRTAVLFLELQWASISAILMIMHDNLRSLTREEIAQIGLKRDVEHPEQPARLFVPPPVGTPANEFAFAMARNPLKLEEDPEPRIFSKNTDVRNFQLAYDSCGANSFTVWLWTVNAPHQLMQVTLSDLVTIDVLRMAVGEAINIDGDLLHILPGGDSHRFAFDPTKTAMSFIASHPPSMQHPWYVWNQDEDINVPTFLMESAPRVLYIGPAASSSSAGTASSTTGAEQPGGPQTSRLNKRTSDSNQGSDPSRRKSDHGKSIKGSKGGGSVTKSPESVPLMNVVDVSVASHVEFALKALTDSESYLHKFRLRSRQLDAKRELVNLLVHHEYKVERESDLDGWIIKVVEQLYRLTPGEKTFFKREVQSWIADGLLNIKHSGGRVTNTVIELKRGPGESLDKAVEWIIKHWGHFMYMLLNQANKYSLSLGARFILVSNGVSTRLIELIHEVGSALAQLVHPPVRTGDCWSKQNETSVRSVLAGVIYELDKMHSNKPPPASFNMIGQLPPASDQGGSSGESGAPPGPDAQHQQGGGGAGAGVSGDGGFAGDGMSGGGGTGAAGSSSVRKADAWKTAAVMNDSGVDVEDLTASSTEQPIRQQLLQLRHDVLPAFLVECPDEHEAMMQEARKQHHKSIWASHQIGGKMASPSARRSAKRKLGNVFAAVYCGTPAAIKVVVIEHASRFFAENNNYEKLAKLQEGPIAKKLFAGIRDDGNLVMVVERGYVAAKVSQSGGDDGSSDSDDSSSNYGDDESSDDDQSIGGVGGNIATVAAAGSEAEPAVGATDGRPSDLKLAISALQQIHEHEAVHGDAHLGNVAFVGVEPHRRAFWFDLERTWFPDSAELKDLQTNEIEDFQDPTTDSL